MMKKYMAYFSLGFLLKFLAVGLIFARLMAPGLFTGNEAVDEVERFADNYLQRETGIRIILPGTREAEEWGECHKR